MDSEPKIRKLIKIKDVMEMTGLSRSGIYARMKEGTFPRQYKLSHRHVAWDVQDVFSWMNSHPVAEGPNWVNSRPGK